jgi:hypothetical protein
VRIRALASLPLEKITNKRRETTALARESHGGCGRNQRGAAERAASERAGGGAGVRDVAGGGGGDQLRPDGHQGRPAPRNLQLRLREALGDPAARRGAHTPRPRRYSPGPVRHGQDLHDRPHRLPEGRYCHQRVRPFKSLIFS